ncbi:hypothetical protein GWK47_020487 [Chionoecetes opilio]|uniref:Uncharacterized protein n=1 Tax=Chionoecetes opilio TaxID=41210 RepID=A0A8J4XPR9_CHIOP|nr:hypothetical protein GWK47_020487 [Chionoecetes opilio]
MPGAKSPGLGALEPGRPAPGMPPKLQEATLPQANVQGLPSRQKEPQRTLRGPNPQLPDREGDTSPTAGEGGDEASHRSRNGSDKTPEAKGPILRTWSRGITGRSRKASCRRAKRPVTAPSSRRGTPNVAHAVGSHRQTADSGARAGTGHQEKATWPPENPPGESQAGKRRQHRHSSKQVGGSTPGGTREDASGRLRNEKGGGSPRQTGSRKVEDHEPPPLRPGEDHNPIPGRALPADIAEARSRRSKPWREGRGRGSSTPTTPEEREVRMGKAPGTPTEPEQRRPYPGRPRPANRGEGRGRRHHHIPIQYQHDRRRPKRSRGSRPESLRRGARGAELEAPGREGRRAALGFAEKPPKKEAKQGEGRDEPQNETPPPHKQRRTSSGRCEPRNAEHPAPLPAANREGEGGGEGGAPGQYERRIHPPPAGSTWQARKRPTPRPGPWEGPGGGGGGVGGWLSDACDASGTSTSDESVRLPMVPRGRPGNARRPDPALGRVRAGVGGGCATPATLRAPARATNPSASCWFHVAGQETPDAPTRPLGGSGRGWRVAERRLRRSRQQHERRIHPPPSGFTWQTRKRPTPRPGPWEGPGEGGVWLYDVCDALGTSLSDVSIRLPLVPRGRPGNHQHPVPALGRVRAGVGCGCATSATHWAPAGATYPSASHWFHVAGQETPNTPPRPLGGSGRGWGVAVRRLRRTGHQLEQRIHPQLTHGKSSD